VKDISNCPYCQAEVWGCSEGWALSPEGWDCLWEIHLREHCNQRSVCPTCGQVIVGAEGVKHAPPQARWD